jgi:SAM-dependent methyltransferase
VKLSEVIRRKPPEPWADAEKIPWNDPGFSARMLRQHLSQQHDAASRRSEIIDRHVDWIHHHLLGGRPARILDLGCGPGLYTARLARLGHHCIGIDFSPSSIQHARSAAEQENLPCEYRLQDLREGGFGSDFQLALMASGEFNAFPLAESIELLENAAASLASYGLLVLEVHTAESIREIVQQPPSCYSTPSGLFSDAPHICLKDGSWSESEQASVERYFVIDASTGEASVYASTLQAYSEQQYCELLSSAGLPNVIRYASLEGSETPGQEAFFVLSATKPEAA